MKKIFLLTDFLYHDINPQTNHLWVFDVMLPSIQKATDVEIHSIDSIVNSRGEVFSRKKFFELSGIYKLNTRYFNFDINAISKDSIGYLSDFVNSNVIVFGFELGTDLLNILDSLKITYINLWFHSFKLFDDIPLLFNTNNEAIFNKLIRYQIPQDKFYFYANYYKIFTIKNHLLDDTVLAEHSALFIGQTLKDISVFNGKTYLNVSDYKDKLKDIAKNYSCVYYVMHPHIANKEEVMKHLSSMPYMKIIEGLPTYALLASDKIEKVFAISSSVIYEAKFFNKDAEYLYQPLFNIDVAFGEKTFISVENAYFGAKFWFDILSPVLETKIIENDINYFSDSKNRLRRLHDLYWGYSIFDENKIIENKINLSSNTLNQKINSQSSNYFKLYNNLENRISNIGANNLPVVNQENSRDFSFNSGERQTGKTIDEIRKDHLIRYQLCSKFIKEELSTEKPYILDVFSGNGYGSSLISKNTNGIVFGIEGSKEAVDFANLTYADERTFFINKLFPFELPKQRYDAVISLESVEHVENDDRFLATIIDSIVPNGMLFLSAPNRELNDLNKNPNKFHFRHYLADDILKKTNNKLILIATYGQNTYISKDGFFQGLLDESEFELKENIDGQFMIFVLRKKDI